LGVRPRLPLALIAVSAACQPAHSPETLRFDDLAVRFAGPEWALMTSPIQPPMSRHERQRITVWLHVPRGQTLRTQWSERQGRYVLGYPAGTVADRVEMRVSDDRAWALDVRGTEFLPDGGERFHVLRRDPRGDGMIGREWVRGDDRAEQRASAELVAVAAEGGEDAAFFRQNMRCERCHVHDEPTPRQVPRDAPPMATDAGGLFRVTTVLEDRAPLVESRARDVNLDSPFVTVSCASGPPAVVRTAAGTARARCPRDDVPMASFDLRAALAAADPHARAVCASRAFLYEHLGEAGRAPFRDAFAECGLSQPRR
jgi:hypothetical protein